MKIQCPNPKTIANIGRVGVHQALTGPVVRGDVQTVETHVQAISEAMPELLPFYNCLVHYTAVQAAEGDRISPDMAESLSETDKADRLKYG